MSGCVLVVAIASFALLEAYATTRAAGPATQPPRPRVLFIGSSSIERWKTLPEDFPEADVVVHGVGARRLGDIAAHAERDIVPHRPDKVFVYAGSIDLGDRTPEQVRDDFAALCETVHRSLPGTTVYFIACKPSLSKWGRIDRDRALNGLVLEHARRTPGVGFVDVWTAMVGDGEKPPETYFVADRNHLSPAGYRLWADVVRPYVTGDAAGDR
jgi:lysophospholipase L1-like esterase